ncbi:hypothetical protein GCM10023091_42140 [Ravibacter arvi]|uniref:FecR family protein n=2 Tax=Ravibacter arvi TaxID=2051041 RepID=A0ABP8MB66_9BACT
MDLRSISQLIEKYRAGKCTPEEKEILLYWFNTIDHEPANNDVDLSDPSIKKRIWEAVLSQRQNIPEKKPLIPVAGWWQATRLRLAAAAILLLLAIGGYFSSRQIFEQPPVRALSEADQSGWLTFRNNETQPLTLTLKDSSTVTLEPGSLLAYPSSFDSAQRLVRLEGTGTFDIMPDPGRPFLVYSKNIRTKVLGTSFTITSGADGSIEVAVHSGKVAVEKTAGRTRTRPEKVVLTPNRKVVFREPSESFVVGLVDQPQMLAPSSGAHQKEGTFTFDETRLAEVLEKIGNAYGVTIHLGNPQIADCPVTANLNDDNFYTKLEVIAAILNLTMEVRGDQVYLKGDGCKSILLY